MIVTTEKDGRLVDVEVGVDSDGAFVFCFIFGKVWGRRFGSVRDD